MWLLLLGAAFAGDDAENVVASLVADIEAVVQAIQPCVAAEKAAVPGFNGTWTLSMTVQPTGVATSVTLSGSPATPRFTSCVTGVVTRYAFSPVPEPQPVEKRIRVQ